MTNGILSIKHKRTPEDSKGAVQQKRQPAYRIFVKGKNYVPKQVRIFQNLINFLFPFSLFPIKFTFLFNHDFIAWFPLPVFSHVSYLQDDYLVSKPVRQHLAKYDKLLRKFNVSKALDAAMEVCTVLIFVLATNGSYVHLLFSPTLYTLMPWSKCILLVHYEAMVKIKKI